LDSKPIPSAAVSGLVARAGGGLARSNSKAMIAKRLMDFIEMVVVCVY
jgi:hypothetical protein